MLLTLNCCKKSNHRFKNYFNCYDWHHTYPSYVLHFNVNFLNFTGFLCIYYDVLIISRFHRYNSNYQHFCTPISQWFIVTLYPVYNWYRPDQYLGIVGKVGYVCTYIIIIYIYICLKIWSLSFTIRIGSDWMTFTSFTKDPFPLKRIRSTRRRNPHLYIAGKSCTFPFTITIYLQQLLWYYYDRCLVGRFYLFLFIFFFTSGWRRVSNIPKGRKCTKHQ